MSGPKKQRSLVAAPKPAPMKRWLVDYSTALCESDLSQSARHVGMVLALRADNATGRVHLKRHGLSPRALIAHLIGGSESTVSRAMKELVGAGWVKQEKRGPWVDYTVTFPPGSSHSDAIGSSHSDAVGVGGSSQNDPNPGQNDAVTESNWPDRSSHIAAHVCSSVCSSDCSPPAARAAREGGGSQRGQEQHLELDVFLGEYPRLPEPLALKDARRIAERLGFTGAQLDPATRAASLWGDDRDTIAAYLDTFAKAAA